MSDVQYWEDTLTSEIERLHLMVDKLGTMRNLEKKLMALGKTEKKLRQAHQTKRSLRMEIRLITEVSTRRQYEQRYQKFEEELRQIGGDVKALKTEAEREELALHGGGRDEFQDEEAKEEDYVKQGDNMLEKAGRMQEETQESLDRTKQTIAESKQVGVSTLEELERQRGVIENIDREADRIDDNLARAEKLIKHFGKRMASDKFIQCFAVINVLLLVGVVLYAIFGKGNGLSNSRDDGAPANPLTRRLFLRKAVDVETVMIPDVAEFAMSEEDGI